MEPRRTASQTDGGLLQECLLSARQRAGQLIRKLQGINVLIEILTNHCMGD